MREYQKVDKPHLFPMRCLCGSQKGSMVDTFVDTDVIPIGRLYICKMCAWRMAVALGMVKGDEYEKLAENSDFMDHLQKEIRDRNEHIKGLEAQKTVMQNLIDAQAAEIEQLQGKVQMQRQALNEVQGRIRAVAN